MRPSQNVDEDNGKAKLRKLYERREDRLGWKRSAIALTQTAFRAAPIKPVDYVIIARPALGRLAF